MEKVSFFIKPVFSFHWITDHTMTPVNAKRVSAPLDWKGRSQFYHLSWIRSDNIHEVFFNKNDKILNVK